MNQEEIYTLLTMYFDARKVQKVPTDLNQVTMYALHQKSSLYLINIISLNNTDQLDKQKYDHYLDLTKKQFQDVMADHVILLNLIITPDHEALYDKINEGPDLDASFIDVHWLINSESNRLIIPSKQMKSVIGLEATIRELLYSGQKHYYAIEPLNHHAYLTLGLITLLFIVWGFLEWQGGSTNSQVLMRFGAMNSQHILETGQYWRLFTSMFLHIGVAHLLFNTFALLIFGIRLEHYMTWPQFFYVYIGSGLLGSAASFGGSFFLGTEVVAAGASGAIYGLIGSILVLSRAASRPLEGLTSYTLWLIFIIGLIYSVVSTNVDAFAHIGGFVGGLALTWPLVVIRKKTVGGDQ